MSWRAISARKETVTTVFYQTLFAKDERLRALFKNDIAEQQRMLSVALNLAVSNLDRIEEISESLRNLGRRHVHYGARVEHYNLVAESLIEALQACADPVDFDARAEAAWRRALDVISREMLAGAEGR